MKVESFRDLIVWQRSRLLVKAIYQLTKHFPADEKFGLTMQLRRAAISIPSNIAEGFTRHGTKDYISFISVALGSAAEVETQLTLAEDLEYVTQHKVHPVLREVDELQKMLHKMRKSLQAKL